MMHKKEDIMKLYNTLSRRKEEFIPLEEGKLRCMSAVRRYTILSISETQDR